MPRMKSLTRTEYRAAVANLLDLGFTPPAIAYMTGKTDVAIYTMLERLGRKIGRDMVRRKPVALDPAATRFMARLFSEPDGFADHLFQKARKQRLPRVTNGGLAAPAME